ncbi:MAG: HigA family addiction module antidote protein [Burkholderiaceae bacterium]|nr:HigA family addiction module antidote protein [Burkholderiaceae bacterium]
MAEMFDPPHPGLTIRDEILPVLGLSVTEAAAELNVSRVTLSRLLNGRAAVSAEMALKLEAWLARRGDYKRLGGPSARSWLARQLAYDLWQARQRMKEAA